MNAVEICVGFVVHYTWQWQHSRQLAGLFWHCGTYNSVVEKINGFFCAFYVTGTICYTINLVDKR